MSEQLISRELCVEQKYDDHEFGVSDHIQRDALRLADVAMRFARVERVPRYDLESRESNVEHSFMLALIAPAIAARFFPELDAGLVARFSIVHDLIELKTGDIATFAISEARLAEKARREKDAVEELCAELDPDTARLVRVYEEQAVPEARFVRLLDKFTPLTVDILGPGSEVLHEDYATHSLDQLDAAEEKMRLRFEKMFPDEFLQPLHLARSGLARKFRDAFRPVPIQDTLF